MKVWYKKVVSKDKLWGYHEKEDDLYIKYEEIRHEICCDWRPFIKESDSFEMRFDGEQGPKIYLTFNEPSYGDSINVLIPIEFCPFCGEKHEVFEEQVVRMRRETIEKIVPQTILVEEKWIVEEGEEKV